MAKAKDGAMAVAEPTNGASDQVASESPYIIHATIQGSTDMLLHAWNCEAVEEKSKSKKGSESKKTDNLESYVRRNEEGFISLPSEYIRMSIIAAAKFRQDPRSPRKSAMDLYKAAIVCLEPLCPLFNAAKELPKIWDYEDKRRVQVQRNGITRVRPAFRVGWSVHVDLMCVLPEYIASGDIHDVLAMAGRVVGVGDFRPTYGRFRITRFELGE